MSTSTTRHRVLSMALLAAALQMSGCAATNTTVSPTPAPPASVAPTLAQLGGAPWLVRELDGKPVAQGTVSSVQFSADGRVSGSGGCNNFTGAAQLKDGGMTLGPLASTRKLCVGAEQQQEDAFFAGLAKVRSAQIVNGLLVMSDVAGKPVLRLGRVTP
jgi:putative lipoprotein